MSKFINKTLDQCGDYLTQMVNETTDLFGDVSYQTWLILSTLAIIVGFSFLKPNR